MKKIIFLLVVISFFIFQKPFLLEKRIGFIINIGNEKLCSDDNSKIVLIDNFVFEEDFSVEVSCNNEINCTILVNFNFSSMTPPDTFHLCFINKLNQNIIYKTYSIYDYLNITEVKEY